MGSNPTGLYSRCVLPIWQNISENCGKSSIISVQLVLEKQRLDTDKIFCLVIHLKRLPFSGHTREAKCPSGSEVPKTGHSI